MRHEFSHRLDGQFDLVHGAAGRLDDGRVAVFLEVNEMPFDKDALEFVIAGQGTQLQEQTLAQITGPHARRLEPLDQPDRSFQNVRFEGRVRRLGYRLEVGPKVAVVVDVIDDMRAGPQGLFVRLDEGPLTGQVFLKRNRATGGVRHRVHLGVTLGRGPGAGIGAISGIEVVLPAETIEAIEPAGLGHRSVAAGRSIRDGGGRDLFRVG